MADIISIKERQQAEQARKALDARQHKARVVERTLQRTLEGSRCEKCGTPVAPPPSDTPVEPSIPYRFCSVCQSEYNDFIAKLQSRANPQFYWQNDDWLAAWRTWIDYQGALDRYSKSKEFRQLIQELNTPGGVE